MAGGGKKGQRGEGQRGKGVTIIRRSDDGRGAGHHGGAWKVAYADFVTAMMAFFLLMWLLNATTEAQRKGLADYFTPNNLLSHANSGNGEPFGGRTPYDTAQELSDNGAVTVMAGRKPPPPPHATRQPLRHPDGSHPPARQSAAKGRPSRADASHGHASPHSPPGRRDKEAYAGTAPAAKGSKAADQPAQGAAQATASQAAATAGAAARQAGEQAAFHQAAAQIRAMVAADPGLSKLTSQLAIDITPRGLRIQIMDESQRAMFATGSAAPQDWAAGLLARIVPILRQLPEGIAISGYTDAAPYHGSGRSNWDLSADRANAVRRLLTGSGLPQARILSVTGRADRDLLLPADPLAAANRRITILVRRDAAQR